MIRLLGMQKVYAWVQQECLSLLLLCAPGLACSMWLALESWGSPGLSLAFLIWSVKGLYFRSSGAVS